MTFARRRFRNALVFLLAVVVALMIFQVLKLTLLVQQYYSGWLLVFIMIVLLLFGVKKRLSVLPLGSNAAWAQLHYYLGLFLIVIFLIHIEFSLPNGAVEVALTCLLIVVVTVGIIGLIISRLYAKRLSQLGEEVIYERIPVLRSKLKNTLESQLLESVERSKSSTLSTYYLEKLSPYFATQHDFLANIVGNNFQRKKRRSELEQQLRYLSKDEAHFAIQMLVFLEQKYILDCHSALQGVLKFWSLLHVPIALLTGGVAIFHIVLVYAFRGAM